MLPYRSLANPAHSISQAYPTASLDLALYNIYYSPNETTRYNALRDYILYATNADTSQSLTHAQVSHIEQWAKGPEAGTVIDVLKSRLDHGWPHNYKALDALSFVPASHLVPLIPKLTELTKLESDPSGLRVAQHVVDKAKSVLDKAQKEKTKMDADKVKADEAEGLRKEEAIMASWGSWQANMATQASAGAQAVGVVVLSFAVFCEWFVCG